MKNTIINIYKKTPHWLKNKYTISICLFLIWIIFLDANNLFVHIQKEKDLNNAKKEKAYLEKEIEKTIQEITILSQKKLTPTLEKKYREVFFLSKKNEEIFLTE